MAENENANVSVNDLVEIVNDEANVIVSVVLVHHFCFAAARVNVCVYACRCPCPLTVSVTLNWAVIFYRCDCDCAFFCARLCLCFVFWTATLNAKVSENGGVYERTAIVNVCGCASASLLSAPAQRNVLTFAS